MAAVVLLHGAVDVGVGATAEVRDESRRTIVGTGVIDGVPHAYAMVLVPAPGAMSVMLGFGALASRRRRRWSGGW